MTQRTSRGKRRFTGLPRIPVKMPDIVIDVSWDVESMFLHATTKMHLLPNLPKPGKCTSAMPSRILHVIGIGRVTNVFEHVERR